MKNFSIAEKDKASVLASLKADEMAANRFTTDVTFDDGQPSGFNRKSAIIVTVIILLAATFAVGIYFAIELSTA